MPGRRAADITELPVDPGRAGHRQAAISREHHVHRPAGIPQGGKPRHRVRAQPAKQPNQKRPEAQCRPVMRPGCHALRIARARSKRMQAAGPTGPAVAPCGINRREIPYSSWREAHTGTDAARPEKCRPTGLPGSSSVAKAKGPDHRIAAV